MAIGSAGYEIYSQGLRNGVVEAIPRSKFNFTLSLNYLGAAQPLVLKRIANVAMPGVAFRTQTLNKYNSKAIVQTGIDYTPITLTAYDTKDAEFEKFLKNYADHYFKGPLTDETYTDWLNSPKGYTAPGDNHYIKSMIMERVDGPGLTNTIEVFNPFIQSIDADTLDYSDSGMSTYRITFAYEGYRIVSENSPPVAKPVTPDDDPLEAFGGAGDDFDDEYEDYPVTPATKPSGAAVTDPKGNAAVSNQPQLKPFKGKLKTGEKIRNINGKSYVVPAPTPPLP